MNELHADSIQKSYGDRQILTDIYISCGRGEIVGLLGRNGEGKSTLLKIIFGSVSAEHKYVRVNGDLINKLPESKGKICYLPQDGLLPSHLTISKIVELFCSGVEINSVKNIHFIKPLLYKKSRALSGGERRLIEVILTVHADADYILIDEPFNGIAPVLKAEIASLIKEKARTKGFIVTDHDYNNILSIASKVIILGNGCTKEMKSKDELIDWGYLPKLPT